MLQEQLEVTQVDNALRFQTEDPHLVSMGSGRLSTAVTIHPLPMGQYIFGLLQRLCSVDQYPLARSAFARFPGYLCVVHVCCGR